MIETSIKQSMSKTAIVSGATGLVGSVLVKELLDHPSYTKVIAVVRKKMDLIHDKLEQLVIDFGQLPSAIEGLSAHDGFCCLGTTIKSAGTKERQYQIDHDYVIEFARGCLNTGVTRFSAVSSIGASARSGNFYLRTKGEMEEDLKKLPFEGLFILQPSLLMGDRKEHRIAEKIAISMMRIIGPLMSGALEKYRGVDALNVARCMIACANGTRTGITTISSEDISKQTDPGVR